MRIIFAALLALSLTACATFTNPINRARLDTLDATWGAALAVFNGYKDACAKRLIPSSCRTNVITAQKVVPVVQAKVNSARSFALKSSLSTFDLVAVAEGAVADFKQLQTRLGMN